MDHAALYVTTFPDLNRLPVPVSDGDLPYRGFFDRLQAFYRHVGASVDQDRLPRAPGVRLHPDDDRELLEWCAAGSGIKLPSGVRLRLFMMAWLDKGPATSEDVTPGDIHVVMNQAYPPASTS